MTEHSWFGPASQASQQCSQDLHTMFPLLPPSSAFYENSQDEYPADGPHNVSSRTMTARTVTTDATPAQGAGAGAGVRLRAVPPRRRRVPRLPAGRRPAAGRAVCFPCPLTPSTRCFREPHRRAVASRLVPNP